MIAMLKKTSLLSAFCLLIMLGNGMSEANATLEIVAKVNGKAITNYQVDQRATFLRTVTNLENTAEIDRRATCIEKANENGLI